MARPAIRANCPTLIAPAIARYVQQPLSSNHKGYCEIPGPKGLPFIGTVLDYMFGDANQIHKIYHRRAKKYGPIHCEQLGPLKLTVINDPREYQKVVQSEGSMPHRFPFQPMNDYRNLRNLGPGLTNSNGPEWYNCRGPLKNHLMKSPAVAKHSPIVLQSGQDFVNAVSSLGPGEVVPDIEDKLFRWSLESVAAACTGMRLGCLEAERDSRSIVYIDALRRLFGATQKLLYAPPIYRLWPTPTWKTFVKNADVVFGSAQEIVDEALSKSGEVKAEDYKPLLAHLLNESKFNRSEATSLIVELLIAAVETTANAALWTLYCLSTNLSAQGKLREEITQAINQRPGTLAEVKPEILQAMPYLKACVREALRLYPIIFATSRILQRDMNIAGYRVPKGTHVQGNVYSMCRDESLFPEPESFRPERWTAENREPLMGVAQFAFGHGPRQCIGKRLAELEVTALLVQIFRSQKVTFVGDEHPEAFTKTVLTPSVPLRFTFESL